MQQIASPVNFITFLGGCASANQLAARSKLMEVLLLAVGHVLFEKAARVRDLSLLADVVVLHGGAQGVVIGLDKSADLSDMESVGVSA